MFSNNLNDIDNNHLTQNVTSYEAINNHNPQDIIKSENGNLLNWNQELKLPKDI
jgi:hypothetical protein